MSMTVTARPRGSYANSCGLEHVGRAALGQRPRGCSALVMSSSATYRFSAPGCRLWSVSGHTQPSWRRSPEANSSRFSLTAPAVTPCGRSPRHSQPGPSRIGPSTVTMALSGSSRSALFISAMPSAPSARTMPSMVSLSHGARDDGAGHDRLVRRPPDPRQHRDGNDADRDPQHRQVRGHHRGDERQGDDLGAEDAAAHQPDRADVLVQAQPFRRVGRRDGLMPEVRLLADPPPAELRERDPGDADERPPGRQGEPLGRPDRVVQGVMAAAADVPPQRLGDALPGAQVRRDDVAQLARLPAALRLRRGSGRRTGEREYQALYSVIFGRLVAADRVL